MSTKRIVTAVEVKADPSEVYRMFTDSSALREWLADAALSSARPGGRIVLGWNDGYLTAGRFTALKAPEEVSFTWRGTEEPDVTKVKVSLQPTGAGTLVKVRHSGFGNGKKSKATARAMETAWNRSLENLASVLEAGEDLRFTRRPMLGVFVDAEARDAEGAPIGVKLGGTVDGMGAAAAGLVGGDIVNSLGGRPVRTFTDLGTAASAHRAGDVVEVGFLRDGVADNVQMKLSGREIGEVEMTAPGLAGKVGAMCHRFAEVLAATLEGVTDEEANRRPAEGAWSVKEIIAHLIDGEGDLHAQMVATFEGVEPYYDGGYGNSHWRTKVTADSYPDVASMVDSYRHLMAQTVGMISSIPAEAAKKRASFWRVSFPYNEGDSHFDEHVDQIKAAIAAARA
jgi:uncharacterized protein YndB with AHSA1/START domain